MIVFAPYFVLIFWGTIIFFGLRSMCLKGEGPLVSPIRSVSEKLGNLSFVLVAVLFIISAMLATIDSIFIGKMMSPVGIFTMMAFFTMVIGNMLLVGALYLGD